MHKLHFARMCIKCTSVTGCNTGVAKRTPQHPPTHPLPLLILIQLWVNYKSICCNIAYKPTTLPTTPTWSKKTIIPPLFQPSSPLFRSPPPSHTNHSSTTNPLTLTDISVYVYCTQLTFKESFRIKFINLHFTWNFIFFPFRD